LITSVFVYFEFTLPWGLHAAPLVTSMMLCGAYFGQLKLLHKGTVPLKWNILNTISAFAIYFVIGLLYPKAGWFAAGTLGNHIGFWDVFITFLSGVFGAYILVNVGKVIEKIPVIGKGLEWIGVNTLPILLIHMCLIRFYNDILHVQKQPMGTIIEKTNWMSVLVFILAVISTAVLILLFQFVKKCICVKKGVKNESFNGAEG
jgi:hypothetical protein